MEKELEGDLFVTDKSKAEIPLPGHRKPSHFHVKFDNDRIQPPCNPHHYDCVEAELIQRHGHGYNLLIKWHVSSVRAVRWSVRYDDEC